MPKTERIALETGSLIELTIDTVAFGGQGVGRYQDMVVFVPLMVDGDEGIVEITEVKKRYVRGRLMTLTKASGRRTEPLCPVYGLCGGCQYQHIVYDYQLVLKQQQIRDTFTRIGRFDGIPLAEIIPSPEPWHYRQKADFHIQKRPNGDVTIGFARSGSHDILNIERCHIVDPGVNQALVELRQGGRAVKGKGPDGRVVLWSNEAEEKAPKGYVSRSVKGQDLLIPRQGFFQANGFLAETLVKTVLDMSALTGKETVVDGFCGSGFFSVFLASGARKFYGVEFVDAAVQAADRNLKAAGIHHGLFYAGDVGRVLKDLFVKNGQRVDVLVLDPPRIGLDAAVLKAAGRLKPARIVYVSCNPATMARDVRILTQNGFRLEALQPLDMFPQTSHVEVVGLLRPVEII